MRVRVDFDVDGQRYSLVQIVGADWQHTNMDRAQYARLWANILLTRMHPELSACIRDSLPKREGESDAHS